MSYSSRGFIPPLTFDTTGNSSTEFTCPGATKITVDVSGDDVYVMFSYPIAPTPGGDPYDMNEFPLRQGFYSFERRTNKVRFRSTGTSTVAVMAT